MLLLACAHYTLFSELCGVHFLTRGFWKNAQTNIQTAIRTLEVWKIALELELALARWLHLLQVGLCKATPLEPWAPPVYELFCDTREVPPRGPPGWSWNVIH